MKCVVPGANVKILAKAIHALAKVGDEMYVQPQEKSLSFRTVNGPNSAYADFTFCESYFSYYVFGGLAEDDTLKCKVSMRSALAAFKGPNTIDKQVETCHIKLRPNATALLVILKYKNSIIKTYLLPIIDCEKLQATYTKDNVPNQLTSQPRVFGDAIQNFQQNLIEITLEVTSQKVLLRNYVDDTSSISNVTRTQIAFGIGEFDRYVVGADCTITFCMKEIKAILAFAEVVGIPLSMYFEAAGRPVVFVLKNPSFEVNLVLSTLNPDVDVPTTSVTSKQENSVAKKASKPSKRASKSTSRKQSAKANQTKNKTLLKTIHPCLMENDKEAEFPNDTPVEIENNDPVDNINTSIPAHSQITEGVKLISVSNDKINEEPGTEETSLHLGNGTPKSNGSSRSNRKLINSVFASMTKRKTNSKDSESQRNGDDQADPVSEDSVTSSQPPSKKARMIFKKCFQLTFDTRMLPGHDDILAEDSDECVSD